MSTSFFDMLKAIIIGTPESEREDTRESLLHVGWQQRDESFYPSLFGPAEGEPVLLTEEMFKEDFDRYAVHPFWLHHGVLTFPPTETRKSWIYATSGMSNAFDSQIDEWSGLGVEYIMETPEKADWAADKLAHLMTFNLLISAGHYRDQSDLKLGSVVKLEVPVDGGDTSALTSFIALSPLPPIHDFELVTGKVELLHMVAVTETEADYAKKEGHKALAAKLAEAGHHNLITIDRASVV